MSAPYARFFTPPLRGESFPLPRARDVVKTSVFTRPRKRDSSISSTSQSQGPGRPSDGNTWFPSPEGLRPDRTVRRRHAQTLGLKDGSQQKRQLDRHPVILTVNKEDNGKGAGLSTFRSHHRPVMP